MIYTIISVYVHQSGCYDAKKDNFYDELRPVVAEIPTSEILILLGDWNWHVCWIWGSTWQTWLGHTKY